MSLLNRVPRTWTRNGIPSRTKSKLAHLPHASAIAIAVASCFAANGAFANPYGFSIVNGQVFVNYNGNTLNVTNTPGAIINWQGFSIGVNEITRFIQQSASSTVLNRVVGVDPSIILGTLQSNGRVFLINPNGVVFGAGSKVDVSGLVASTLNLSNADFAAGRARFTDTPGAGSVINQGTITTPSGGQVYLIAPNVQNHGIINSPQGEVILAAGKSVEIVDSGTPNLRVQIDAPSNEALNLGQIIAQGGKIGIYAGLIRNGGEIRADGVVVGANGEIMLKATKNVTLDQGSVVSASGPAGGKVTIQADTGTVAIAGTVAANATQGKGGTISISGAQGVSADSTARISADGPQGGSINIASGGNLRMGGIASVDPLTSSGGQITLNAAAVITLVSGGQLSASGGLGGGAITVNGGSGVTFEQNTVVRANGGGTVNVQANQGAFSASGMIDAAGIEVNGGNVNISAGADITLESTSAIIASGRAGGTVRVESTQGTLLASGLIDARGNSGPGGKVYLLAPRVALLQRALVDVSGQFGGGMILVGGDFQGKNPFVQNALRTYVGRDVILRADGGVDGDGGKVIVWSNDATRFYGTISARGGDSAGNGGFAEVSGKNFLDFKGRADLGARNGRTGTLLLDPNNVTIGGIDGGEGQFTGGMPNIFDSFGSQNSVISWSTINTNIASANLIITTNGSGSAAGNITIASSGTLNTPNTFQLVAHNNIDVNASISNTGSGDIRMYAGWDGYMPSAANPSINSGSGSIAVNAPVSTLGNIVLVAGNGISQTGAGILTANGLVADGGAGAVNLAAASNMVNIVTGHATGGFNFKNAQSLTVGSVGGYSGVFADGGEGVPANVAITVTGAFSTLTVNESIRANDNGQNNVSATVTLTSPNGIVINGGGGAGNIGVFANGGYGTSGDGGAATITLAGGSGPILLDNYAVVKAVGGNSDNSGGTASVDLTTTGGITIQGNSLVKAEGGGAVYFFDLGNGGSGTVTLSSGAAGIALDSSSSIHAMGGDGGEGTSGAGGIASVSLTTAAAGGISLANNSWIRADGGNAGNGALDNGGAASVTLTSGLGGIHIDSSYINAYGGTGGIENFTGHSYGGDATVTLTTTGPIQLLNGSFVEAGGGNAYGSSFGNGGKGELKLTSGAAGITIDGAEGSAYGGNAGDSGGAGGASLITLNAGGGAILLDTGANLLANFWGDGNANGGAGGDASIVMTNASSITFDHGSWLYAKGGGGYFAGGALVDLTTNGPGGILLDRNSYINAYGGSGGDGGEGGGTTGGYASINFTAMAAGGITVRSSSSVYAAGGGSYSDGGDANVTFTTAAGNILLDSNAMVSARGGDGATFADGYYGNGGSAILNLSAGGSITIQNNASVKAYGGQGGNQNSDGVGGEAGINLNGTTITVDGGEGYAIGGHGGYYSGSGGDAWIGLGAGAGPVILNNALISVYGGGMGGSSSGGYGGWAEIDLGATGAISITGSNMYAQAGDGVWRGGNAVIYAESGGTMTVTNSTIDASSVSGSAFTTLLAGIDLNVLGSNVQATGYRADGGEGSIDAARIELFAVGNLSITNSSVTASSTNGYYAATVDMVAAFDNGGGAAAGKTLTTVNSVIKADGGEGGGIFALATGDVALGSCGAAVCFDTTGQQYSTIAIGSTGGALIGNGAVLGTDNNGVIELGALKGIGSLGHAVRFTNTGQEINVCNGGDFATGCMVAQSGRAGDVFLAQTTGDIIIDYMGNVLNFAPNGGFDATAEAGNIIVSVAMVANGNGRIGLHALGGGNTITLDPGASLSTANGLIVLRADNIDVFSGAGSINAGVSGTIQVSGGTATTAIDLGGVSAGGVLGISNTTLAAMTAGTLRVGEIVDPILTNTGGITVSGAALPGSVNTLSLETMGNIVQSAGLTVTKLVVQSGGNVDLSNMGNNVGTVAADLSLGTGSFGFGNTAGYAIGSVNGINGITAVGDITLASNGVVTQSQPISAAGLELLGTGTFNLNTQNNTVATLAGDAGIVKFKANAGFDIGTVNASVGLTTTGNTTLDSTGPVTQSAAVGAAGLELLGAGGNYALNTQNNAVATLAANTGAVRFRDNTGFDIGTVNATVGVTSSGNTTLDTAGGVVTQSQVITASGLELLGAGGAFNLGTLNNAITTLAGNTNAVAFKDNSGFAIGTVNATNGLTTTSNASLNTIGTVTQTQAISAAGLELLGPGGTYNLSTVNNAITTLAVNTGTIKIKDNTGFSVGTVYSTVGLTTTGNAAFDSSGAVTQSQKIVASGLELLGAGGTYTLTNGANDVTTLAANTGSVTYTDTNALLSATVGGTTGITGTTLVSLNANTLTGTGTITAPTVNLTTANGMSVKVGGSGAGLTATNTTAGDLILTGTGASFTVGGGGATFTNAAVGGGYYISALNNMQLNGGSADDRYASFTAGGTLTSSGYNNASGFGVLMVANGITFNGAPTSVAGALGVISGGVGNVDVTANVTAASIDVTAASINVAGANFDSMAANFTGYTTGDVTVSGGGRIYGNPDVMLTVGGNILINGAGSKIEAASATSVHATFPTLTSGGYVVNGVPGVVWDAGTGTGFFAGGAPASLGNGFVVAYGAGTTTTSTAVVAAINTIVDATNKSSPSTEKDKDKDKDKDGEKGGSTSVTNSSSGVAMQCN